jgi:hypothetical protein
MDEMSYYFFLLLAGLVGIASVVFQILAGEEKIFNKKLNERAITQKENEKSEEVISEVNRQI